MIGKFRLYMVDGEGFLQTYRVDVDDFWIEGDTLFMRTRGGNLFEHKFRKGGKYWAERNLYDWSGTPREIQKWLEPVKKQTIRAGDLKMGEIKASQIQAGTITPLRGKIVNGELYLDEES